MNRKSLRKVLWPLLTSRAKAISNRLLPFLEPHWKVIDIGAGNMLISKYLVEVKKIQVQGIDVIDMNLTDLPHRLYDGSRVPFKDKSFDASLLISVLHHAENQEELLKEAIRVSSSKIIVHEDIYNNRVEKLWVEARDILGNITELFQMKFALNFRTDREWNALFEKHGLEIEQKKNYFNPFRLTHHTIYLLAIRGT